MKFNIQKITSDASFRNFYRIKFQNHSKILVFAKKNKYQNLVAYLSINKFLRKNKILTPKIFQHNYKNNFIIIEDFGNISLYKILLKTKFKLSIYKKIIDLLIKIQKIKPKKKLKTIINKMHVLPEYSNRLLHKESDLFFDWYLPLFLKRKKVFYSKMKIKKTLSKLYKKLNFNNKKIVHRDYHVFNLMRVNKEIGLIDTQDALIGNPAYDLASIVDDVRIQTSNKLKEKILKYYLKKAPKIYNNNLKKFIKDFYILSIQRNLKIIGVFARLYKRDRKKKYLKLIPHAWKLLDLRLKEKGFEELKSFLDILVPNKIRKKVNY